MNTLHRVVAIHRVITPKGSEPAMLITYVPMITLRPQRPCASGAVPVVSDPRHLFSLS